MSAVARMMTDAGITVSGCDRDTSALTEALSHEGIEVMRGHSALHIGECDLVVYSQAISDENEELRSARRKGVTSMSYPEVLGAVTRGKFVLAVSGCHGKTTTTAMLAKIFRDANLDPTVVVGSIVPDLGGNFIAGQSKFVVVEACEYRRAFLHLDPIVVVITNIDQDHLDYYSDIDDIKRAFRALADKVPSEGAVIADLNDTPTREALSGSRTRVISYGQTDVLSALLLKVPGAHNMANARAAAAAASFVGVPNEVILKSLSAFRGSARRFENRGTWHGVQLIDDYAHHPREIRATLAAARDTYPQRRIVVVFQPHLYSRTQKLFDDFVHAFDDSDELLVADIYAAREPDTGEVSSRDLVNAMKRENPHVQYVGLLSDIVNFLHTLLKPDDVLLTMGAGDVYTVIDALKNKD